MTKVCSVIFYLKFKNHMITIKNFKIENNLPFSLEFDQYGEHILTTGRYITQGEPTKGGLAINFQVEFDGCYENSWIAIFQKCKYHEFYAINSSGDYVRQDIIDNKQLVLDGVNDKFPYYRRHLIKNNNLEAHDKFDDKYLFQDIPYVYLEKDWQEVSYNIIFKTYICYTKSIIEPCIYYKASSFRWYLKATAKKDENNHWKILTNKHSTNEYIFDSVKVEHAIFNTFGYKNLKSLIHNE